MSEQTAADPERRYVGDCAECGNPIRRGALTVENREDSPTWHSWCYARMWKRRAEAREAEIARLTQELDDWKAKSRRRYTKRELDALEAHLRERAEKAETELEAQQAEIARLTQERDEARVERDEYVALTLRAQAFQQREMDVAAATTATLEAREAAIARVAAALRQIARDIKSQGHSCTEIDADLPGHLDTLADQLAPASPQEPTR